jgi:hypothetical protein
MTAHNLLPWVGTEAPDFENFTLYWRWTRSHSSRIPGRHWPDQVAPPNRKKRRDMRRQLDRLLSLGNGLMWLRETLYGVNDFTPRTEVYALAHATASFIVGARPAIVRVHRAVETDSYHVHIATPCRTDGEPECCEETKRAGEEDRDLNNVARYLVEPYDGRAKNSWDEEMFRRRISPAEEAFRHAAELYLAHAAIYRQNRRFGKKPGSHPRMRFYLNWSKSLL